MVDDTVEQWLPSRGVVSARRCADGFDSPVLTATPRGIVLEAPIV